MRMNKWWKTVPFVWINSINKQLYLEKISNHLKLKYTEPCNFLTKRALVGQPSALVDAKDSNISHYLNLLINSPTIILPIV